jgi:anti-sigma factor RsiW
VSKQEEWDCGRACEELDAFVRGELPLTEVDRMTAHLKNCGHCSDVAKFEEAFRQRLRELDIDTCCPDELKQRIKELLVSDTMGSN